MATTTTHVGPLSTLPENSTPGLQFLAALLPTLDSLAPNQAEVLSPFMKSDAKIIINGNPPQKFEDMSPMFVQRAASLSSFRREVKKAWDIASSANTRTVMCESTSFSVFKEDKEGKELGVEEFNVVELESGEHGELKVVESRVWMDYMKIVEWKRELEGRK